MGVSRVLSTAVAAAFALAAFVAAFATKDARAANITGTTGSDSLVGTAGDDHIDGLAGSDSIVGLEGNDTLIGGPGSDTITGGAGDDVISARDGAADTISCGAGADRVTADAADVVSGDCETVDRGGTEQGSPAPPAEPPPPAQEAPPPPSGESGAPPSDPPPAAEPDGPPAPQPTSGGRGTTITVTSGQWRCNRPLAEYGELPITVVHDAPNGNYDAIRLEGPGCTGDGNARTIDLILDVRGNGGNRGPGGDGIKVARGAHDIQVTGRVECGARAGGAHQDHVQVMSGQRIEFRELRSGNTATGSYTCWGAGGAFFVAATNGTPTDVVCVRCAMAAGNQGLHVQTSNRSGARDSTFRARRADACRIGSAARDPVNVSNRCIRG